ncbi:MAG: hypothetical protein ACOYL5_17145 [Phototrophicaceae bacterium]|jgi:hypothetical protein
MTVTDLLSPRETRLLRAADWLRGSALVNGGLAVVAVGVALLQALGVAVLVPFTTAVLFRYTGNTSVGLSIAILLMLVNMSAALVVMVGIMAREVWGVASVWVLIAANVALLIWLGFTPAIPVGILAAVGALVLAPDLRAFRVNPVMLKELRGRMRGMRAFIVLTLYLGLMAGFLALIYLTFTTLETNFSSAAAGAAGRLLFMGVVGIELLLIIFIAPAFTAGAITGERERQTYDLLRTTLLASTSFVMGKLESALSYILLLLLAAIPLQSLAFLFGGVSPSEVLIVFVILIVMAITLGTVGIYFSAIAPRTLSASVRTYTVTLIGAFGAPLVLNLLFVWLQDLAGQAKNSVLEATFAYLSHIMTSLNPVAAALASQQLLINQQELGFTMRVLSSGVSIPLVSPWISFSMIYLAIAAVLLVLTVRAMQKPEAAA